MCVSRQMKSGGDQKYRLLFSIKESRSFDYAFCVSQRLWNIQDPVNEPCLPYLNSRSSSEGVTDE